jgi:hypothetical protein
MKLTDLTEIEKKTYEFIKKVGEIQPKNMPDRRTVGAVINLKNKGHRNLQEAQRQISQEEEEICKGERTKRTPNKTLPNAPPR